MNNHQKVVVEAMAEHVHVILFVPVSLSVHVPAIWYARAIPFVVLIYVPVMHTLDVHLIPVPVYLFVPVMITLRVVVVVGVGHTGILVSF
jgi:hypothetical protein